MAHSVGPAAASPRVPWALAFLPLPGSLPYQRSSRVKFCPPLNLHFSAGALSSSSPATGRASLSSCHLLVCRLTRPLPQRLPAGCVLILTASPGSTPVPTQRGDELISRGILHIAAAERLTHSQCDSLRAEKGALPRLHEPSALPTEAVVHAHTHRCTSGLKLEPWSGCTW